MLPWPSTKELLKMYVPKSFEQNDQGAIFELIEKHSFATLVAQNGDESMASHLPLQLDRERGANGTLIGHMARANPHWRIAGGQSALAIFHGAHAYISPKCYQSGQAVPTWNYAVVHAYGKLETTTEPQRLLDIVASAVRIYEPDSSDAWRLESADPDYLSGLLNAIVGFEIEVERYEAKWKLSQNHDAERQLRIIQSLQSETGELGHEVAKMMAKELE